MENNINIPYSNNTPGNTPLMKISGLTVAYDDLVALQDVDLTIMHHDFLGVIGPNGGGKTTLVKAMLGLVPVKAGQMTFYDEASKPVTHIDIGYLPQYSSFDFSFPITVGEVVMTGFLAGRSVTHRYTRQQRERAQELLQLFELADLSQRSIGDLSGGQRQRVLMARSLVSRPQMLILDEPSTYIDKESEGQLYSLLRRINSHCAIVLVSHDVGTLVQEVRNVACVNRTLHYHPASEPAHEWFEDEVGCPLELVAHGHLPHRVLAQHEHHATHNHTS